MTEQSGDNSRSINHLAWVLISIGVILLYLSERKSDSNFQIEQKEGLQARLIASIQDTATRTKTLLSEKVLLSTASMLILLLFIPLLSYLFVDSELVGPIISNYSELLFYLIIILQKLNPHSISHY